MISLEQFYRMDLRCIYTNNMIDEDIKKMKGFFIYLIVNYHKNKFYVGLTTNLYGRIQGHIRCDTNEINEVYLLEELDNEKQMRFMEKIWINYFMVNSVCVNKTNYTSPPRDKNFNDFIMNTRYKMFIDTDTIKQVEEYATFFFTTKM